MSLPVLVLTLKSTGWAVADSLETSLVLDALDRAVETRRPRAGLLHHSDRGCQYASDRYRRVLDRYGIECSMSRTANCWDNAPMERFMGSLKNEWSKHHRYATVEDVHRAEPIRPLTIWCRKAPAKPTI